MKKYVLNYMFMIKYLNVQVLTTYNLIYDEDLSIIIEIKSNYCSIIYLVLFH